MSQQLRCPELTQQKTAIIVFATGVPEAWSAPMLRDDKADFQEPKGSRKRGIHKVGQQVPSVPSSIMPFPSLSKIWKSSRTTLAFTDPAPPRKRALGPNTAVLTRHRCPAWCCTEKTLRNTSAHYAGRATAAQMCIMRAASRTPHKLNSLCRPPCSASSMQAGQGAACLLQAACAAVGMPLQCWGRQAARESGGRGAAPSLRRRDW